MKCITCSQEIPDTSTTCPYCNNKVEPLVSASQALGVPQESVLPQTPQDYKLPKDQMTQQLNVVNESTQVAQNIPAPPPVPDIPAPPAAPITGTEGQTQSVGLVQTPPAQPATATPQQSYFDPTKINLDNVDLNANANAQTLDYTQMGASEKLGSTIDPKKPDEGAKKKKKKVIILGVTLILLIAASVLGVLFYFSQYQSSQERINKVVDGMFNSITSIKNSSFEEGSGNYKLNYSSAKNADEFKLNVEGKYAYNLPNKKVDIISNYKSIYRNQELLDDELNVELYLENNRAYFLLQNFKDDYVYTDIDNSYNVIKDIETRFDKPEELLLFKLTNTLFDNGLNDFSTDYYKYITNISQNEVNYQTITKGIRDAVKETLNSVSSTQSFQNGNNIIKISVKNPDTFKNMNKTFVDSLKNNKNAWGELTKIYGNDNELYTKLMKMADEATYQGINSDIVIATDAFKKNLKYITIPSVKDNKICITTITPVGGGYRVVSKVEGREIVNVTYTKSTSKTSTTETKNYKFKGIIYTDNVADNIDIELELVKDINPQKINVVTRNSIDYQYLTQNDFSDLATKIENYGNLGVLFKSHYKGIVPTSDETDNSDATIDDQQVGDE